MAHNRHNRSILKSFHGSPSLPFSSPIPAVPKLDFPNKGGKSAFAILHCEETGEFRLPAAAIQVELSDQEWAWRVVVVEQDGNHELGLRQRQLATTTGVELFLGSKVAYNSKTNPKIKIRFLGKWS